MITAGTDVTKQCPYVEETDMGRLEVTCPDDAPELHELGEQVENICGKGLTHEEFTRQVHALLPKGSLTVSTWRTGRWDVKVSEGGKE